MKEPKPIDLNATANFIKRQVSKDIEERKTTWFIAFFVMNLVFLGFLYAEYKQLNRNYETLQDKHELTQVMLNKRSKDE